MLQTLIKVHDTNLILWNFMNDKLTSLPINQYYDLYRNDFLLVV